MIKTHQDRISQSCPLPEIEAAVAEDLAEGSILSRFVEAPRKGLCILEIMTGCAENIPLKTDRHGSSAEVPIIAHVTAEAKAQATAWGKHWRKRMEVDGNRLGVLNTAHIGMVTGFLAARSSHHQAS